MTNFVLPEFLGNSFNDNLVGTTKAITYGLGGNDTMYTPMHSATGGALSILDGGLGNDTYIVADDFTISNDYGDVTMIMDHQGFDTLSATGMTWGATVEAYTIEGGRHLALKSTIADEYLIILDWRSPEGQIELYQFSNATVSSDQIAQIIKGDLSYDPVPWFSKGFISSGDPGALNDAIANHVSREHYLSAQAEVQSVGRIYEAGLNRPADEAGLNFWFDAYQNGMSKNDLSHAFLNSPEFQQAFGNPYTQSAHDYVNVLYLNVLGRPSDGDGAVYWETSINNGLSREDALLAFADNSENVLGSSYLKALNDANNDGFWTFL